MHVYEVRPRNDHRGVDLISDVLPFVRLWYGEPDAVSDSVCARHTAMAETAARPSQGRRSKNVMTMFALS